MSAGAVDDLVIPVRIDASGAVDGLHQVGRAGQKAGDDVDAGMDKGKKGAHAMGSELADLVKAQIGLGAIKQAASEIGAAFKETSEYIGKTTQEFQQFRQSLVSTASLSGNGATNKFAEQEIDRAQRAHVTPEEMRTFRESFLAKASTYVGNGPQSKMTEEDAGKFQEYLSEYAKQKGVSQQEMAGFAGGLLAQQKGPTTLEEMKTRVGKSFATLEASSAPVSHLLPAMTRVMAQGYSAEEASRTLAAMPEVSPDEEGTHLLRVQAEIRRNVLEGKGAQYGITDEMGPQQQLEAVVKNLRQRSGGDRKKLDQALQEFTHEDIAGNTLRGMVHQTDFDAWKKVQDSVAPGQLDRTIRANRGTETGRQMAVDSRLAVERARLGIRNDELERRRKIAETELTAGGAFERFNPQAAAAAALPGSDGDAKSIQVNQQMLRRARAELGEGMSALDNAAVVNRGLTDARLRELMPRIREMDASGGSYATRFRRAAEETNVDLDAMPNLKPAERAAQETTVRRREIADARHQLGQGVTRADERAAQSAAGTDRVMHELLAQIAENTRKAPPRTPPMTVGIPHSHGGARQ